MFCRSALSFSLLSSAFLLVVMSSCSIATPHRSDESRAEIVSIRSDGGEGPQAMTQAQLREEVMRFAYRFAAHVNQQNMIIAKQATSSEVRHLAKNMRIRNTWTAVDVAMGPNPEMNLLDMLLFVTLSRMVVEDYWVPQVLGEQGAGLVEAWRKMEADIWTVGARILDQEQQEELRGLIRKWREQHPDQYRVAAIRFGNIAPQLGDSTLDDVQKAGGLLGHVQQAAEAVDEVRILSERVLFFMKALLPLVHFEAEATLSAMLAEPEIQQVLSNTDRLAQSTEPYAAVLEGLPEERRATLNQVTLLLATERKKLVDDLIAQEDRL